MASVPATRRVCTVCCQQVAQYTCPRCHRPYCSSNCYKLHGQQCTESFYREQATSQMRVTIADKQQQHMMMDILQRLHDQGQLADQEEHGSNASSEEEEESDAAALLRNKPAFKQLVKRAAKQADNFDLAPSDLTPELVVELEQLLLQGQLSNLVTPWQPWWTTPAAAELQLSAAGQRGIVVLSEQEQEVATSRAQPEQTATDDTSQGLATLPEPPAQPLPSLSALAGPNFKPSPLLHWQLLQLLVAYCAIMRMYNGEPDDLEFGEAADQLLQLAPPLSHLLVPPPGQRQGSVRIQQQQQQSVESSEVPVGQLIPPESLRSACMQLTASAAALGYTAAGPAGQRSILQIAMLDALTLLQLGRSAILLALTDSKRIVNDSAHKVKQHVEVQHYHPMKHSTSSKAAVAATATCGKQSRQNFKRLRQHLKLAGQKLLFFSVWCNEQPSVVFQGLAAQLQAELQEQSEVSSCPAVDQSTCFTARLVSAGQAAGEPAALLQPAVVSLQHSHLVHSQRFQQQGETELGPAAQQLSVEGGQHGAQCLKPLYAATSHSLHPGQLHQSMQLPCVGQFSHNSGVTTGLTGLHSGDHLGISAHDSEVLPLNSEGQNAGSLYDLD